MSKRRNKNNHQDSDSDFEIDSKPKKTRTKKSKFQKNIDGFYSDYMGSTDDREKLDEMDDLDREEELEKRRENRERLLKIEKLKQKKKESQQNNSHSNKQNKQSNISSISSSSDSGSDYSVEGTGKKNKKKDGRGRKIRDQDRKFKNEIHSDSNDEQDDKQNKTQLEEQLKKELQKITLNKETLMNLSQQSQFEEKIIGLFVRIKMKDKSNKDNYIYTDILEVKRDSSKEYTFNEKKFDYHLLVQYNKIQKLFPMIYVSSKPFTEGEFTNWIEQTGKSEKDLIKMAKDKFDKYKQRQNRKKEIDQKELQEKIEQIKKKIIDVDSFKKDNNRDQINLTISMINQYINIIQNENKKKDKGDDQNEQDLFEDEIDMDDDEDEEDDNHMKNFKHKNNDPNMLQVFQKVRDLKKLIRQLETIKQQMTSTYKTKNHFFISQKFEKKDIFEIKSNKVVNKQERKKKLMKERLEQLNKEYMKDQLNIFSKFSNFEQSEQNKKFFSEEVHNDSRYEDIQPVIMSWETQNIEDFLQNDKII